MHPVGRRSRIREHPIFVLHTFRYIQIVDLFFPAEGEQCLIKFVDPVVIHIIIIVPGHRQNRLHIDQRIRLKLPHIIEKTGIPLDKTGLLNIAHLVSAKQDVNLAELCLFEPIHNRNAGTILLLDIRLGIDAAEVGPCTGEYGSSIHYKARFQC